MGRLGKAILIGFLIDLASSMALAAMANVIDGKDIFGRKIEKNENRVDRKGRIHLGEDEYEVV